ncbi:hypothetical protein AX14_009875 [Amanita brunnescens Koide BX004]|nr:hypothetical protein AX14_009875 [Amanita brunnescens Koide BX004]
MGEDASSGETYPIPVQGILDFIETTRYQRPFEGVAYVRKNGEAYIAAPPDWEVHKHPIGDVYFYNRELRLITPDDITDNDKLARVMESWDEHMENMEYDPMGRRLGDDWELILSDLTESSVVIEVISRNAGKAYKWSDNKGLQLWEDEAHYWSLLAEYPSHHLELPPGIEAEFVNRIFSAKTAVEKGCKYCPLTVAQIDQVIARYDEYQTLQKQGQNVTPMLTWLMGVVMPLNINQEISN